MKRSQRWFFLLVCILATVAPILAANPPEDFHKLLRDAIAAFPGLHPQLDLPAYKAKIYIAGPIAPFLDDVLAEKKLSRPMIEETFFPSTRTYTYQMLNEDWEDPDKSHVCDILDYWLNMLREVNREYTYKIIELNLKGAILTTRSHHQITFETNNKTPLWEITEQTPSGLPITTHINRISFLIKKGSHLIGHIKVLSQVIKKNAGFDTKKSILTMLNYDYIELVDRIYLSKAELIHDQIRITQDVLYKDVGDFSLPKKITVTFKENDRAPVTLSLKFLDYQLLIPSRNKKSLDGNRISP